MVSRALGTTWFRPSCHRSIRQAYSRQRTIRFSWSSLRWISHTSPSPAAVPKLKEEAEEEGKVHIAREGRTSLVDSLFRRPRKTVPAEAQASSSDELRKMRQGHVFGSSFSKPDNVAFIRGQRSLSVDDMLMPDYLLDPTPANKLSDTVSFQLQQEETFANYPRLNPAYGRTVELNHDRGRDLVRSISMLGSLVARNKMKYDFNRQRYYERPGLKRKRLKSERWRANFKIGFNKLTSRVTELTKKGW